MKRMLWNLCERLLQSKLFWTKLAKKSFLYFLKIAFVLFFKLRKFQKIPENSKIHKNSFVKSTKFFSHKKSNTDVCHFLSSIKISPSIGHSIENIAGNDDDVVIDIDSLISCQLYRKREINWFSRNKLRLLYKINSVCCCAMKNVPREA